MRRDVDIRSGRKCPIRRLPVLLRLRAGIDEVNDGLIGDSAVACEADLAGAAVGVAGGGGCGGC